MHLPDPNQGITFITNIETIALVHPTGSHFRPQHADPVSGHSTAHPRVPRGVEPTSEMARHHGMGFGHARGIIPKRPQPGALSLTRRRGSSVHDEVHAIHRRTEKVSPGVPRELEPTSEIASHHGMGFGQARGIIPKRPPSGA